AGQRLQGRIRGGWLLSLATFHVVKRPQLPETGQRISGQHWATPQRPPKPAPRLPASDASREPAAATENQLPVPRASSRSTTGWQQGQTRCTPQRALCDCCGLRARTNPLSGRARGTNSAPFGTRASSLCVSAVVVPRRARASRIGRWGPLLGGSSWARSARVVGERGGAGCGEGSAARRTGVLCGGTGGARLVAGRHAGRGTRPPRAT